MATHSSVLAWRIPGMGEPGGLPSMGSHRVKHDWSDLAAAAAICFVLFLEFLMWNISKGFLRFVKQCCFCIMFWLFGHKTGGILPPCPGIEPALPTPCFGRWKWSRSVVSDSVAYQAPPSMGFSRQRYWSGLPFPSPGDLLDPGIKPRSLPIADRRFTVWATREAEVVTAGPPGKSIKHCILTVRLGKQFAFIGNIKPLAFILVLPRELRSTEKNKWNAGRMGEGIVRESGMDMDTLLCLTWRTSKDLLSSTGNSAQCHVAAWMGGEFGAERIHVYVWLSPFAVHPKPSQHF